MNNRIEQHKKHLHETRAQLNEAIARIGDDVDQQIYSEGAQWTLRQLVVHLALADAGHNQMLFRYAKGEPFIPEDYDIERYNQRSVEKQSETTVSEALEMMRQSREILLEWLDNLEDETVLDKTGRHANLQILTLSEILNIQAEHERVHARDIVAMLDND